MLKSDIMADAFSQATISGLTREPTPSDLALALVRIEGMAAELEGRGICVGYNFTAVPDANDEAGIELQWRQAFATNLAMRIVPDFGIQPSPALVMQAQQSMSNMSARTAQLREVPYPSRHPVGSGNTRRWQRHNKFYPEVVRAPISCDTRNMAVGEIEDYAETWLDYLDFASAEEISTYTLEASSGLRVVSESLTSPIISFRIEALKVGYQNIIFTVTTDAGRVDKRDTPFNISEITQVTTNA